MKTRVRHRISRVRSQLELLEPRLVLSASTSVVRVSSVDQELDHEVQIPYWVPESDFPSVRASLEAIRPVSSTELTGLVHRPADVGGNATVNLDDYYNNPRFIGPPGLSFTGTGFTLAVIDSGFDLNHEVFGPDTDNNGVSDRVVAHCNFAVVPSDCTTPYNGPGRQHGTAVAAVAAGYRQAAYHGVAINAHLALLRHDGSEESIARALQWVVDNVSTHSIVAVNMSFGTDEAFTEFTLPSLVNSPMSSRFTALASQRVALIAAAGNLFNNPTYQALGVAHPAINPNVLGIGASFDSAISVFNGCGSATLTSQDDIVPCSKRDTNPSNLDLFAPGAMIDAPLPDSSQYLGYSGTSFAAPYVAGMALIAQEMSIRATGVGLTMSELRTALRDTGVNPNNGIGYVVDASALYSDDVPHPGSPGQTLYGSNITSVVYPRLDAQRFADAILRSKWLPGDFDLDRDVDSADLLTLQSGWTGGGGTGRQWYQGDCDWDGDVDSADILILIENWTGSGSGLRAMAGGATEVIMAASKAKDRLLQAVRKTDADVNGDGIVSGNDFALIMADLELISLGIPATTVADMVNGRTTIKKDTKLAVSTSSLKVLEPIMSSSIADL